MAEMLIKMVDATNPDPVVDQRGCYKAGMPVVVAEDGHQWGGREGLPSFGVFRFPEMTKADLDQFTAPQMVQDGFEEDGVTPKYDTVRPRRYQFDLPSFPAPTLAKLQSTGEIVVADTDGDITYYDIANLMTDHDAV
jgi:hypothetical protein